jgi:hypothetical protein
MKLHVNPETSKGGTVCYSLRSREQEGGFFEAAYFLLVCERLQKQTGHTAVANPVRFAGGQLSAMFQHPVQPGESWEEPYLVAKRVVDEICEPTLKEINALD